MTQIASIDWESRRFFLHTDTVTNGFDAWEAFQEVRDLQAANLNNEQNYQLFLRRVGGLVKRPGFLTPRYIGFLPGWRGVPVDSPHRLDLLVEMVSDDQVVDADMFDRTGISSNVDIDPIYEQVEVIEVSTSGSSYTLQEIIDGVWGKILSGTLDASELLSRLHRIHGLEDSSPLTVNAVAGTRVAGDITQVETVNGDDHTWTNQ